MNADNKKRGLGRGLDALFKDARKEEQAFEPKIKRAGEFLQTPSSAAAAPSPVAAPQGVSQASATAQQAIGTRKLSVDRLTPGKFQPRRKFDDSALDQLAESIAHHGVLQPLLVRPISSSGAAGVMYEIIAGERRWRAAQKAQVHEVPVVVQELSDTAALEIALIENLQREDLTAIEEAEGFQRLMDEFSHTQDALANRLGKSRSHVANTLRLLKLPQAVRTQVQTGALSAGHARALIGAKNPEELADAVVKRGLSVRDVERLVKKAESGKPVATSKKKPAFVQKDVDILALEERVAAMLGLKIAVEQKGAGGVLRIEYKSLDQLDDVIARLMTTPRK